MKPQTNFKELPLSARLMIVLFGVAGLIALLCATAFEPTLASGRIIVLMALAAGSARFQVDLFKGSTLSFLTSVVLLAVISEGPAVAILVGLCGVTVQTLLPSKQLVLHRLAFNAGMIALTVAASWWTYHMLAIGPAVDRISAEVAATIVASFTYFLGNSVSVSVIVALTKGMSAFQIWFHHFLLSAPSFLIAGLLALGLFLIGTQSFMIVVTLSIVISVAYYCSVRVTALTAR